MRFEVLDSWRGVCALLVALFHLDALSHVWGIPFLRNAYLFVDFFFVLSGFVISHAYGDRLSGGRDLTAFMIRRLGRVWPLHLAVLAAFVAIEVVKLGLSDGLGIPAGQTAFDPAGRAALATLPSQIAMTQALGLHDGLTWNLPSWSISAEFWTYLVFGFVCVFLPKFRSMALAGLAVIAAVVLVTRARNGMDATFDLGFARCIVGFMLGHFAYRARQLQSLAPAAIHAAAYEWAAVLAVVIYVSVAGRGPASFAAPLVFAAVVYVFSFELGPVSQLMRAAPFKRLGLWSYSIYMVHDLIAYGLGLGISVMQRFLAHDLWRDVAYDGATTRLIDFGSPVAADILTLVYLAAVVALSALTYRFIEEPGQRVFNRIAGRSIASQAAA